LKEKGCFEGKPGTGNLAMFIGIFLTYSYEVNRDLNSLELLNHWFSIHNETQNPQTGFWGNGFRQTLYKGFQNALHQFVIYNYWKRNIQYHTKIIDTLLTIQDKDGFFAPVPGGGGCWDYDAADILINCGLKKNYKKNEIELSLITLFNSILKCQNPDGGFCESQKMHPSFFKFFETQTLRFLVSSRNKKIIYYKLRTIAPLFLLNNRKIFIHWNAKGCYWDQSDLWNTWFRCLTIAKIENALNINTNKSVKKWKFHDSIGFGWVKKGESK
jgi:hypothetical protein